ncbi:hypothetical protein BEH94_04905 [Candidatus Altiarchaeales archaeon WOR_SM1_SCG]|nr:hypothetical protein BEH94_04905 [Candidatus Altiarchaeales archaeon WOR_SM1_SCG]
MTDTITKSFKRKVSKIPRVEKFIPADLPMTELETVHLKVVELEAMRLVDFVGMEQEDAANKMGVSRRTLWKDLKSARKKIVDALVNGKIVEMHGGNYELVGEGNL